jgi:hypothetical protein
MASFKTFDELGNMSFMNSVLQLVRSPEGKHYPRNAMVEGYEAQAFQKLVYQIATCNITCEHFLLLTCISIGT